MQLIEGVNDPERPGASPLPGIIGAALTAAGLDEGAETAALDPIWQRHVVRSTQDAMALVGQDAMTPMIAVEVDPPTALWVRSCRLCLSAPMRCGSGRGCRPPAEPRVPGGAPRPIAATVPTAGGMRSSVTFFGGEPVKPAARADQHARGPAPAGVPVDRVIAKCGRAEQRQRLLVEGLAWMRRWQGAWQVPDKSSIARARARLGPRPLRELFVEVAGCWPSG